MPVSLHSRLRRPPLLLLLFLLPVLAAAAARAQTPPLRSASPAQLLGAVTFPTGSRYAGTEIGGLSAITYDAQRDRYYVLSDDRGQTGPARFYTVAIDLGDGRLQPGDVTFEQVTFLRDRQGRRFAPRSLDPEGIVLARPGQLYISSEGEAGAAPPIDPFVRRFHSAGRQTRALPLPRKFLPDGAGTRGVRDNKGLESLTITPDGRYLVTAVENALQQDGTAATPTAGSPARLLYYDLAGLRPGREYVYLVSPVPRAPIPVARLADNGLVDLLAVDDAGTFLAVERAFAAGAGNTVRVFETSTAHAAEVSTLPALVGATYAPMPKKLLFDFEQDLGFVPDNIEGATFGPRLADGRATLLFVSDNNFNPGQTTQFVAVAVALGPAD